MEGQHQRASGGRKRRRKRKSAGQQKRNEPVMIVARRPDSPLLSRPTSRMIAASAKPTPAGAVETEPNPSGHAPNQLHSATKDESTREERRARIVQATSSDADEHKRLYEQLIARLVASEGAIAISRAADELWNHEFTLPAEQLVQLQLLEHTDESRVRDALSVMQSLLAQQAPLKRPVLDQRLRRLEESAEERETREAAAELRRQIRSN